MRGEPRLRELIVRKDPVRMRTDAARGQVELESDRLHSAARLASTHHSAAGTTAGPEPLVASTALSRAP